MRYFFGIFNEAGRKAPFATFLRGIHLFLLIVLKRASVIRIRFGSSSFRFRFKDQGRNRGGRGLFLYRERIEDLLQFGDRFIRLGDVCIDAGANQGQYTLAFLSMVGKQGKVVAIEPMEYACNIIAEQVVLNGFPQPEIVQAALSERPGKAVLDLSKGVVSASIKRNFGGSQELEVETVSIDQLARDLPLKRVDFIKLDIEGAELEGLRGAREVLAKHRPIICVEVIGEDFMALAEHLGSLEYAAYKLDSKGDLMEIESVEGFEPCVFFIAERRGAEGGQGGATERSEPELAIGCASAT